MRHIGPIENLFYKRVKDNEFKLKKRMAQLSADNGAEIEQLSMAWETATNKAEADLQNAAAMVLSVYNEFGAYLQSEHGPDYSMEVEWLQNLQQAIPFIHDLASKARELGQKRLDRIKSTQDNLRETYQQGNMGNLLPGNSII